MITENNHQKVEREAAAYGAKYSIADAIERTVCEFVSKTRIVNKIDEDMISKIKK